ncbi:MAG: hypothetical protein ACJ76L_15335 [Conexibacter sp.]
MPSDVNVVQFSGDAEKWLKLLFLEALVFGVVITTLLMVVVVVKCWRG